MNPTDSDGSVTPTEKVQEWANVVRKEAEGNATQQLFLAGGEAALFMTKFSGWLLTITGATIGLTITNLHSLVPIVSRHSLYVGLVLLIASGVSGFLAQGFGLYINQVTYVLRRTLDDLRTVRLDHDEEIQKIHRFSPSTPVDTTVDVERILQPLRDTLWWPWSALAERGIKKGQHDQFHGHKRVVQSALIQTYLVIGQVLAFLAFAVVVVLQL